jgi:hypothetical protein
MHVVGKEGVDATGNGQEPTAQGEFITKGLWIWLCCDGRRSWFAGIDLLVGGAFAGKELSDSTDRVGSCEQAEEEPSSNHGEHFQNLHKDVCV